MMLECQLIFADGTAIDAQAELDDTDDLLDQSSDVHSSARQLAIILFEEHPDSIAVMFGLMGGAGGGEEQRSNALLFPRPDCPAARDFMVALRDNAAKAGTAIISRRLDA
jgi:hypothetical protein